ncbi:hypothetical protein, partial [Candidatus Magnetobacterium casense]
MDHVHGLRYSKYGVMECNVALGFPRVLPYIEFEVIVLHYSLFGSGFSFFYDYIDPRWFDYVKDSKAYKVGYFQDDYQYIPERLMFMGLVGIDRAYSLLQPDGIAEVFGAVANKVTTTLTGYVSETMKYKAEKYAKPAHKRMIDVGYRTRKQPIWRGLGGQDKENLAYGWLLRTRGLRNDVMCCEEGRLYGDDWWRFVGDCRFMLGTEAGASLVDLQNEARR